MASKARKLEKEKEEYIEFRYKYKEIRKKAWGAVIACIAACALFVGCGLYFGNMASFIPTIAMTAFPFVGAIYYIVQCDEKIEKYDAYIAEVDDEKEGIMSKLAEQARARGIKICPYFPEGCDSCLLDDELNNGECGFPVSCGKDCDQCNATKNECDYRFWNSL